MSEFSGRLKPLWEMVVSIPVGCCVTYGDLGQALQKPVSGKIVGRWMASAPEGVPWWRVIAKTGDLPIAKRDPALGMTQRQLLEADGIPFLPDGRVDLDACRWLP